MGTFHAAGSSHATFGEPMLPFYIFYSMFGFQRTGDSIWSAADQRCRGFLHGRHGRAHDPERRGPAARGRPLAAAGRDEPGRRGLRPAFAFELAVVVEEALRRMYGDAPEDVLYYLPVYNEPVVQPPMPDGLDEQQVVEGLYRYAGFDGERHHRAPLLASGSLMPRRCARQRLLGDGLGRRRRRVERARLGRPAPRGPGVRGVEPPPPHRGPARPAGDPPPREVAHGPFVAVSDWIKASPA